MSDLDVVCVNHPKRSTRVRCSSCNNPICNSCMRQSAVGMKCPDCAKTPLRVRVGNPRQYLSASAAGLGVATGAGWVFSLFGGFGFLRIFFPFLVGLGVGTIVRRLSGRGGQPVYRVIAIATTVVGLFAGFLLAGFPLPALLNVRTLLTLGIAALAASFSSG